MTAARLAGRINALLARQAELLGAGDIPGAAAVSARLDTLAAGLSRLGPDAGAAPALAALRDRASRNAQLIQAAREGVADARRFLTADQAAGFAGYDAQGRRATIGGSGPRHDRRG